MCNHDRIFEYYENNKGKYWHREKSKKITIIGNYWDEEITSYIFYLLRGYQDLFPNIFSKMKGIAGEWGQIKLPFKSNTNHVKKRPYRLNPKYKETVKEEIDKML